MDARGHEDQLDLPSVPEPARREPPVGTPRFPTVHDRITVPVTDCEQTAAKIFARCRYSGPDGQTLWKAAAAFKSGLIPESALSSAVTAVASVSPRSPVGYFRTVLADACGLSLGELSELLRRVRLSPVLPGGPPARQASHQGSQGMFRRPPSGRTERVTDAEIHERRNAFLDGLQQYQETCNG